MKTKLKEISEETFGDRLCRLRRRACMTQEEAGRCVYLSLQEISHYETGSRQPSLETAKVLANLYGVSLDYLLGNQPKSRSGSE